MTLGERIKLFRNKLGLKQSDLGELLGTSDDMIHKYENGTRSPKKDRINDLANILKVHPAALLKRDTPTAEDIMETLFELEAHGILTLDKQNDQFILTIDNNFHSNPMLITYLNAWFERKSSYCFHPDDKPAFAPYEISDILDYSFWKEEFPTTIKFYLDQKYEHLQNAYFVPLQVIEKEGSVISDFHQLLNLLQMLKKEGVRYEWYKTVKSGDKKSKYLTSLLFCFNIKSMDLSINYGPDEADFYEVNKELAASKRLMAQFMCYMKQLRSIGIFIEEFMSMKNNDYYICYRLELPISIKGNLDSDEIKNFKFEDIV